jgi:hypothetical protein
MRRLTAWATAATLLVIFPALAGPPYSTDDAGPVEPGQWETLLYLEGSRAADVTGGETGLELNYGFNPDVEFTVAVPFEYEHAGSTIGRAGRIETALKYRFVHQSARGSLPDVAFSPALIWPTSGSGDRSANASVLLPLWAQRDFGPWSVFGGGGWQWNHGADSRDSWLGGLGVTREFGERWVVGAEIYRETSEVLQESGETTASVGFEWRASSHWGVVGSVGPALAGDLDWTFYVALRSEY